MRVFIERREGGGGLADCERVNRKLSALFDLEDPIPGSYTLEVSTPGLARPLRSVEECRRFLGRRVRLRRRIPNPRESGPNAPIGIPVRTRTENPDETPTETVVGTLRRVGDGTVCLDGPGDPPADGRWIAWSEVLAARLDPDLDALLGRKGGLLGRKDGRLRRKPGGRRLRKI